MIPGIRDVLQARRRIRRHVEVTPLHPSAWLTAAAGRCVSLKLESVQRTGSFKIRGALNALMRLQDERGGARLHVVTASAGNHGRALAVAAETLGMRATVFTPRDAARTKVEAIRRHGAELRSDSASYDEAEAAARTFAEEARLPFVSPYNHPDVIAGAGTVALELLEAHPRLDAVVVPIGGGGLISGIATVMKALAPKARVIGVEADASSVFAASLRRGSIARIDPRPTIADGLGGNLEPGAITFEIVRQRVDDVVGVTEEELHEALRGLVREEHLIAEGAGAAAAAAVLAGKAAGFQEGVALVTGANIDFARLLGAISR